MVDILLAAIDGLQLLFNAKTFLFMMIGIFSGMFFGLVPGLSGLTGLGLLIPFAIGQPPEIAFPFLLGMLAVTTQTDTIPAVLIGVPGTAAAQATYLDGFPMSKRGEAGRALSASYLASILGTLVSVVIFILFLPILRTVIDRFAAPEYFIMALLGLIMAGSLAGTSILRGLAMSAFGLMISTIGFAELTGFPRYDFFEWPYLWEGVPMVPLVIGLFAIPEVIDLLVRRSTIASDMSSKGGIYDGFSDTLKNWWLVIKCGVIGTLCGMIPGLGGLVAEWFSYGHAVSSAKDASMFGKGDVRGVIAPEAATAAQKPGAVLPTVAFGIPGNASMAILMGVFLITGLRPGPDMLIDKLDITFMMVWTVVIGNIIAAILCLGLQRWMVLICYIRPTVLAPVILSFMLVGATMATMDFGDVIIFAFFGALGYLFKRTDWPRVPLIIGIVLGDLVERFLFISVDAYGFSWLWSRPIVVIVEIFIIAFMAMSLYRKFINLSSEKSDISNNVNVFKALRSNTWWVGIGFIVLTIYAVAKAAEWSIGGRLFPWVVGFGLIGTVSIHTLVGLLKGVRAEIEPETSDGKPVTLAWKAQILGWIALLLVLVFLIGHLAGIPIFIVVFMLANGERLWLSVLLAVLLWAFVYFILGQLVHVVLPTPLLLKWLG
ncbi:MAG: tripartite tricarboxylate transporter permease [Desulfobacterales bacterium]|nr:tripartite tricarboxylate transporter permease [Desulfobacterales bacterium]MDX2511470.1 tripartite tricarboxylate transporter permease [Desulfobacterales bacterium]